jgi:hypothetical protein
VQENGEGKALSAEYSGLAHRLALGGKNGGSKMLGRGFQKAPNTVVSAALSHRVRKKEAFCAPVFEKS